MSLSPEPALRFVGGRLALDFANMVPARGELSWDQLIAFLQSAHIITAERGGELLALSRSDPQSAESLLRKAQRLASALRKIGRASCRDRAQRCVSAVTRDRKQEDTRHCVVEEPREGR